MAAEREVPEKMIREHWSGYLRFIGLVKWGAIVSLVTAFIVILLIS